LNTVVPLLASLVSLAFALVVLDQYLARRQPYQFVWGVGLGMYFVATGCEFVIGAFGFDAVAFRLWYLFGAIGVAAFLGLGTTYLMIPRRLSTAILMVLLVGFVLATVQTFRAEVDEASVLARLAAGQTLEGKSAFAPGLSGPRPITPFFNIFGTVALVGGALYSAWVFWRRRIMPHRVVSNVLIAAGAMLPALGGTMARIGHPQFLYILELVGVIIIFAGFLRSREIFGLYRVPLIHGWKRATESQRP